MFENLQATFKTVYNLAYKRRIANEMENTLEEESLEEYLNSLDFETIKKLQVIMYVGRDNPNADINNGIELYNELRKEFDDKQNWGSKEVEISQIVSKEPLDIYLKKGFELIDVDLQ